MASSSPQYLDAATAGRADASSSARPVALAQTTSTKTSGGGLAGYAWDGMTYVRDYVWGYMDRASAGTMDTAHAIAGKYDDMAVDISGDCYQDASSTDPTEVWVSRQNQRFLDALRRYNRPMYDRLAGLADAYMHDVTDRSDQRAVAVAVGRRLADFGSQQHQQAVDPLLGTKYEPAVSLNKAVALNASSQPQQLAAYVESLTAAIKAVKAG